jgi:hypothetical protein
MEEVARHYGFTPNRSKFICCPFHNEKTPSLKLYGKSFYCFGCGVHGSIIDFTGQLFGLDGLGAVERLNEDFFLGLPLHRKPNQREREEIKKRAEVAEQFEAFERWREEAVNRLNAAYRAGHLASLKDPEQLTKAEGKANIWKETVEDWSECLSYGDLQDQLKILNDSEDVNKCIQEIIGQNSAN